MPTTLVLLVEVNCLINPSPSGLNKLLYQPTRSNGHSKLPNQHYIVLLNDRIKLL
jgi:hypothetical protein